MYEMYDTPDKVQQCEHEVEVEREYTEMNIGPISADGAIRFCNIYTRHPIDG